MKLNTDLNSREINLEQISNLYAPATKYSLLDFFAKRQKLSIVQPYTDKIINLIDFAKLFTIINRKLHLRTDPNRIVIIPFPRVRFSPLDITKQKIYCLILIIRYSSWDESNLSELNNEETAISRWNQFLKTAPMEVINKIQLVKL